MPDHQEPETLLECRYGTVRLHGETAIVEAAGRVEIWRGPFRWEVGSPITVKGPRGPEEITSAGEVISTFRLRQRRG